jgi:hypothetical protein
MPPSVHDTQPMPPPEHMKRPPSGRRFRVPWGLFVGLGFYALAVLGYIWATYWRTPEYQASEHVDAAALILGPDRGAKLDQKQMEKAYDHYLKAALLVPKERWIHEKLQRLRYDMDERGMKLSKDLQLGSDAVAMLLVRIENEQAPLLAVGFRDRGWTPDLMLGGPKTVVLWSIPGGVLICIFFFFRRFTEGSVREEEHEAESKKREQELLDLERARTLGSVNKDGTFKEREGDLLTEGREVGF